MSLSHRPRRRPGTCRRPGEPVGERGAVVVEMAIVAVLLITILGGAYDFGMGWRASLAANEAARAGARTGSSLGISVEADRSLLLSVQSALSSSGLLDEVQRVIVFDAGAANGKVPSTCITGTSSGACNIFTATQFKNIVATSPLDAKGCISSSSRKGFCPLDRDKVQIQADSLGVWVRLRYEYQFGLLGNALTIDRQAVMRLEP